MLLESFGVKPIIFNLQRNEVWNYTQMELFLFRVISSTPQIIYTASQKNFPDISLLEEGTKRTLEYVLRNIQTEGLLGIQKASEKDLDAF